MSRQPFDISPKRTNRWLSAMAAEQPRQVGLMRALYTEARDSNTTQKCSEEPLVSTCEMY